MVKKPTMKNSNPAPLPALVKEEKDPPATAALVKQEEEAEPAAATALDKQGEPAAAPLPEAPDKDLPPFLKSVNELRGLSPALSTFTRRFNELQKHLDFIQSAIDTMSKRLPAPNAPASSFPDAPIPISADGDSAEELPNGETCTDPSRLEYLFDTIGSRGLRKYIVSHMSDIAKLREEATAALKRAPNPAELVFDCIGRFYLQGSKAYSRDSPMVAARQASLLTLECFLLAGCTHIEQSVKEEANVAAVAWRKRLINEGGVSKADSADARGLLLFVGSYGIPSEFENEDLSDLIRLSNPMEIADALRQSPFLLERIPDIIQEKVKIGLHVEAVDVACTFGLEDKFPPQTILTSFLRESKEDWKRTRRESQGSPVALKEADEKQLAALKSVIKCFEDHKIDPMKLAGWSINVKIANLEKDISELDRKIEVKAVSKRKADEVESSKKLKTLGVKRPRPTTQVSPQIHPMVMLSQEQRTFGLADGKSLYDGRFSGLHNGYSGGSSVTGTAFLGASGGGMLPGTFLGTLAGTSGMSVGNGAVMPTGSFAGIGGGLPGDVAQLTNKGVGSYVWHGDGAPNDNSVGHNFMGLPASMAKGLFGPPPSMEQGFVGQSTTSLGVGNRSSGADLYQFADTVLEGESYYSSSSRRGNPPMAPAAARPHHPSYLY